MQEINEQLKKYVEKELFPIYEKDNSGHGLEHIKEVIKRILKFINQFDNLNIDMVYIIAAYHDIAHQINKDNHEILSAKLFYENEDMKQFFNDEQRKIIKEAIEDHRASLTHEPRSDYGKIISSADRIPDFDSALKRTHAYTMKHYPNLSLEQIIDRAYNHITDKFGESGYAKTYVKDEEYEKLKNDILKLVKDKDLFIKKYLEVNKITIKK